ncbi:hypothetical protein ACQ4WX_08865 [Streptomyces lasalocidi]
MTAAHVVPDDAERRHGHPRGDPPATATATATATGTRRVQDIRARLEPRPDGLPDHLNLPNPQGD